MSGSAQDDGENVFLVPCDSEDFERTVSNPVDLGGHVERPEAIDALEEARLWGAPEGNRNLQMYERMVPGDLLLFYRDGRYVGVGRVGRTFVDEDGWVGRTFWDGGPITHLYTVTDFTPLDIEAAAVNRIFDYGPEYSPGGLMRVADDRVTNRLAAIELAVKRYAARGA